MKPKAPASSLERIRADHREILDLIAAISATTDPHAMAVHVSRLQPILQRHFREEEALDGLHGAIRRRTPEQQAAVHRLVAEHADLLELVGRMRALAPSHATRVELHELGGRLQRRLHAHEAHENEAFMASFWNDKGDGD